MATIQNLLTDIKLRYRHSFTDEQVLVWMNEEENELFEILEIESLPYQFTTLAGQNFYPIPSELENRKIKVVTFQIDDGTGDPQYTQLNYYRNDDNVPAGFGAWYTIVTENLFIFYPGGVPAGRNVFIYADSVPEPMVPTKLTAEPSTPRRYQEILKLGTLERIAAARKDIVMKNNYSADKEQKIADMEWNMKMNEPEFIAPVDMMPHAGRRWGRGAVASYIIPQ